MRYYAVEGMQFKDIIGQEDAKRSLCVSAREGRIPHARLLYGQPGTGKLQLAIAYAQYLACPNRTESDSCGQCPSCLQYGKLQHPDLHFAFPIYKEKPGRESVCDDFIGKFREIVLDRGYFSQNDWYAAIGAETKQGVIYEAESSEILRKLSLKPFTADGFKTMIIWLPEKMNTACANKLLKILEEPPEKTLFLLVSEEPEMLLSTILSRTQQMKIPGLPEQTIAENLMERDDEMDVREARSIAHIANGSWLRALQAVEENAENSALLQQFINLFRCAWRVGVRRDYAALRELREWSTEMASTGREHQKNFLQYMQQQLRENYLRNLHCEEINYQTVGEAAFSDKFAPFVNERNIEELMRQADLAQRQIEQNGNARIIFFDLCQQIIVLVKK